METKTTFPSCPHCGRVFSPGATWHGANYCRGFYLLPIIGGHPNASSWELSQLADLSYSDTCRALAKLRDFRAVEYTPEDRESGGQRYRYTLSTDKDSIRRYMEATRTAAPIG